jgi:hypothetical protein
MGQLKQMHMTSLLVSPPSILSETNSNLWILWDLVFQLNSNFISNLNLNPSELLLCPYISLGAPPPHLPTSILPQNQTLSATHVPPRRRCLSSLPPLFQSLRVVSHRGCYFSGKLKVNPTSPVSSPCRTLTPGLYGYEIECL